MKYIYLKENSEPFTESAATSSGVGSKDWDYEQKTEARQQGRSMRVTSANDQARSRERTFTSGTGTRRASNSMAWATPEQTKQFSVRESGNIGQEIVDESTGLIVAWTTSPELAHRIVRLLNEDE